MVSRTNDHADRLVLIHTVPPLIDVFKRQARAPGADISRTDEPLLEQCASTRFLP
jgi:hypothetical protein